MKWSQDNNTWVDVSYGKSICLLLTTDKGETIGRMRMKGFEKEITQRWEEAIAKGGNLYYY